MVSNTFQTVGPLETVEEPLPDQHLDDAALIKALTASSGSPEEKS